MPGMLQMARDMGFSNPKLDFVVGFVSNYSSIWSSVSEDMSMYVVGIGLLVAVAALIPLG